jgi:hypothetical protein
MSAARRAVGKFHLNGEPKAAHFVAAAPHGRPFDHRNSDQAARSETP